MSLIKFLQLAKFLHHPRESKEVQIVKKYHETGFYSLFSTSGNILMKNEVVHHFKLLLNWVLHLIN